MRNKTRPCILIVAALVFFCAVCVHGQTVDQPSVVIRNVWFEDETGALVHTNVVVNGGRLIRVASIPPGVTVIDGGRARVSIGPDGVVALTPMEVKTLQANGTAPAAPRDTSSPTPQAAEENLAAKVVDPTAPLKTITFQNKFSPSLWGLNDEQNEMDMQLAIPLHFLGRANILRVTLPYLTSSPSGNRGLGDVSIFNIMLFPKKWGTPVAGVVAGFGTNKGPGVDTFAIGPATGVVFKKEKWTYGVFNQNLFSADTTATSQIQPILAYTVNQKVSIAFGDQQFTYDWKKDRFVLLPVGFQVNYIAKLGDQPVRFLFGPQYNFKNELGAHKWTITTGFALILR